MNPKITLEQIYENYKYKIAGLKREREELVATKCMSLEKVGLLVRIESDIEFYEVLNEALEKQIKPEETKALQSSMMLVGQWISRETQARKYSTDEVMNISKALMDLKAYFDKLGVTE